MSDYTVEDALQAYMRDANADPSEGTETEKTASAEPEAVDLDEATQAGGMLKQAGALLASLNFDTAASAEEEGTEKNAAPEEETEYAGDLDIHDSLVDALFAKLSGAPAAKRGGAYPARMDTMGQPAVPGGSDALLGNDKIPDVTRKDTKRFVIPEIQKLLGSRPPSGAEVVNKYMDTAPAKGGLKFSSARLTELLQKEGA